MLNFLGMLAALSLTLLATTVTSVGGSVSMTLLALLVTVGLGTRMGGNIVASSRGEWGMPWGARIASWGFIGIAAAFIGLAGSTLTVAAFGAYVVLDAFAGLIKRESHARTKPVRRIRWKRVLVPLALVAYLGGVAAFHVFVGQYFPFGILITWTLLALAFSATLLVALRGPKAGEACLRAPAEHKRHERREERVEDPQRQRAEDVLQAFRARGDAGPFLDLVRQAAAAADLGDQDVRALEERIASSFARAGTGRDADVAAALDEVEQFLSLRKRPMEATAT